MGQQGEHVVVRLGGCRYALPLAAVEEVGRPPEPTRVPGLPDWVVGVANWRGRVLALVDLRPLLGAGPTPLGRGARVVVLAADGVRVGVLAEAVEGTAALARDGGEPVLDHLGAAGALLCGQVNDATGPVALLDPAAVLRLSERLPRPRRAG